MIRALLAGLLLPALALGCARSSPTSGGSGSEQVAEVAATAADNATRVTAVEGRADTLETDVADADGRLDTVEADVDALETATAGLDTRVTALEDGGGGGGGRDDLVVIDDAVAAGFPAGTTPTNVEEGFAEVNARVDAQDTRTDTLETDFNTDLQTTVTQSVQAEVANLQVQVASDDVTFDPDAIIIDPRFDAQDNAPEYPLTTTLDEAVRALRWAHQVRFQAPINGTLLGDLPRNYAQEAILALDAELYDVRDGPVILGVSAATTGNLDEGGKVGWQAADEKCLVAFGGQSEFAHACTLDEAQRALGGERYTAADFAAPVQAWTTVPSAGAVANCDGGLNGQAGGTGYAVTVNLAFAGTDATGPVVDVAAGVTCDTSLPLLCCR